ncbi:MAG TPA: fatty acid desaturase family protein [Bryobacteraceae bacterium]|jgi:fatty acid desaturase|nr:fatty acid desaturase family protein [Bryobacteraceae bacterium]
MSIAPASDGLAFRPQVDGFFANDTEILKKLGSATKPVELAKRSVWPTVAAVAFNWAIICAAIFAMTITSWWIHPVWLLVIASRQHALLVLLHDASHSLLCRSKFWNEIISDFFCGLPFGLSTQAYRVNHLAHHEHLNTEEDPDLVRKVGPGGQPEEWMFPLPWYRLARLFGRDVSGGGLLFVLRSVFRLTKAAKGPSEEKKQTLYPPVLRLVYAAALITFLWVSGRPWFLLYAWLVPLFCLLPAILRLRSIAEHFALPKAHMLNESRIIHPRWWEAFLVAPHHVSLHLDHHLFPYVPWYRLPQLHRRLLANEEYRALAHINSGFFFGKKSLVADITQIEDDPRTLLKAH